MFLSFVIKLKTYCVRFVCGDVESCRWIKLRWLSRDGQSKQENSGRIVNLEITVRKRLSLEWEIKKWFVRITGKMRWVNMKLWWRKGRVRFSVGAIGGVSEKVGDLRVVSGWGTKAEEGEDKENEFAYDKRECNVRLERILELIQNDFAKWYLRAKFIFW